MHDCYYIYIIGGDSIHFSFPDGLIVLPLTLFFISLFKATKVILYHCLTLSYRNFWIKIATNFIAA